MSLLTCQDVAVSFGGLRAVDEVTLEVPEGQITGLIGPNGAGKTTLFNAVCGLQTLHSGRIALDGRDITTERVHVRARLGIARTFQRLETFGTLTVRDNVLVAAEMRKGWSHEKFKPGELTDELVDRVGISDVAEQRVDQLPTGTQRLVEVARALATKPRVLLLDEPSAGLNEVETTALSSLLRELAATDLAILLVEHDMGLVMGTSDGIHVLDFGRIIATGTPEQVQADPLVRAAYLGEGDEGEEVPDEQRALLEEVVVHEPAAPAATDGESSTDEYALELRDVRAGYAPINVLDGVTLRVRPRQVFALLGPNGAGKSTTLKVASGQVRPTQGTVSYFGEKVNGWSADRLARVGLCTIPEGRGVFPNLTVVENLRMITYSGVSLGEVEERAFERFPRLADRRKQVAGTLSGGEQQMLAMARAMATKPKVLLLDELSMGLAPLIVEELYAVVGRIAAEDVAILIVEQFAHEVLGVANAAAIMLHGRIQYTGTPAEVGETLQRAYLGGAVE
ncbi:MAG TPA: ATP-binding cassette domain-containing protein [Acidimicrobiia bacterium]